MMSFLRFIDYFLVVLSAEHQTLPPDEHTIRVGRTIPCPEKIQMSVIRQGKAVFLEPIKVSYSDFNFLIDTGFCRLEGTREMFLREPVKGCASWQSGERLKAGHFEAPVHGQVRQEQERLWCSILL